MPRGSHLVSAVWMAAISLTVPAIRAAGSAVRKLVHEGGKLAASDVGARGNAGFGSSVSLWALPLQQFVYRQLMYIVIIESTVSALVGARAHWRHITRTGNVEVKPA